MVRQAHHERRGKSSDITNQDFYFRGGLIGHITARPELVEGGEWYIFKLLSSINTKQGCFQNGDSPHYA